MEDTYIKNDPGIKYIKYTENNTAIKYINYTNNLIKFIDEKSKIEYTDYEDLTREQYDSLEPSIRYLINGFIISELHTLANKMIKLDCRVGDINFGGLNDYEIFSKVSSIKELIDDIDAARDNSKYKEGIWKFLDFDIYDFYIKTMETIEVKPRMSLDELLDFHYSINKNVEE